MAITQTVEIPASRRLTITVPPEVPEGRVVLSFTPELLDSAITGTSPVRETLRGIWAICKNAPVTVDDFLAERSRENEREEAGRQRQSGIGGSTTG
jgi:hypothetical protein